MARMRDRKTQLRQWLEAPDWKSHLGALAAMDAREVSGPLLSLLLLGGDMTTRAALCLGISVAGLAEAEPEEARNMLRRFMWHMNEESGNIGWGIPEAFAEVLARSPRMASEFHRILVSYIIDTGRDDNFCDHPVLRRSCYWAVGRLAKAQPALPALTTLALPACVKGLGDVDVLCRGMAAWALAQMPPALEAAQALRRLAASGLSDICYIFDGDMVREWGVTELAEGALRRI